MNEDTQQRLFQSGANVASLLLECTAAVHFSQTAAAARQEAAAGHSNVIQERTADQHRQVGHSCCTSATWIQPQSTPLQTGRSQMGIAGPKEPD